MEAIFAPIHDVPDVLALDVFGDVRSGPAVDPTPIEGDFAAGLRLRPCVCWRGDYAIGLRTAAGTEQRCDFATGQRTQRPTRLNRGDFASGLRRGAADAVERRSVPTADGVLQAPVE
jgi:hypothetical protein